MKKKKKTSKTILLIKAKSKQGFFNLYLKILKNSLVV